MKDLKIQTLLILITLSFCCFSFNNNSQSGHNISQLLNAQPIQIKGWVIRGDKTKSLWTIGKATLDLSDSTRLIITKDGDEMINAGKGVEIYTEETYGDVHVELEFMIPKNGNSGIHFMGEYEVQIWDSYKKPVILANQWMGTIVATKEPEIHVEKSGGEWQKYVIDFRAPRFDSKGSKTENARFVRVELNGHVILENVEVLSPTPVNLTGKESSKGPLMLQGFAGAVAYRGIKIVPVEIP
jgi:hypothetical protein